MSLDEEDEDYEDAHDPVEAKARIRRLKQEIQQVKAVNGTSTWDYLKQFASGIKDLLMGKISTVPELNYRGLATLHRSFQPEFMAPPDLDAMPEEDRVKALQAYAAIRASEASMTNVLGSIVGLHYKTGAGWLVGRIFKSLMGMYILLRIVMELSPIWN